MDSTQSSIIKSFPVVVNTSLTSQSMKKTDLEPKNSDVGSRKSATKKHRLIQGPSLSCQKQLLSCTEQGKPDGPNMCSSAVSTCTTITMDKKIDNHPESFKYRTRIRYEPHKRITNSFRECILPRKNTLINHFAPSTRDSNRVFLFMKQNDCCVIKEPIIIKSPTMVMERNSIHANFKSEKQHHVLQTLCVNLKKATAAGSDPGGGITDEESRSAPTEQPPLPLSAPDTSLVAQTSSPYLRAGKRETKTADDCQNARLVVTPRSSEETQQLRLKQNTEASELYENTQHMPCALQPSDTSPTGAVKSVQHKTDSTATVNHSSALAHTKDTIPMAPYNRGVNPFIASPLSVTTGEKTHGTRSKSWTQEWLQVPSLFYLFAHLIELHELRQAKRNAAPSYRVNGNHRSIISPLDLQREEQLANLRNQVAYSIFEVEGVLLNRLFTFWSPKRLRFMVRDVAKSWGDEGPDGASFEAASFRLLDAISEDHTGTITYTFLYWLRQQLGSVHHRYIIFSLQTALAATSLLCILLVGIFGKDHAIAFIVLLSVLVVMVLLTYIFSLLIVHHNAYADATANFFREQALSMTKDAINDEDESDTRSAVEGTVSVRSLNMQYFSERIDDVHNTDHKWNIKNSDCQQNMTGTLKRHILPAGEPLALRDAAQQRRIEKGRPHALQMKELAYGKHQQDPQGQQEQMSQGGEARAPEAVQIDRVVKNKLSRAVSFDKSISITALVYCQDGGMVSSIVASLWESNFLVLRSNLLHLDSVYRQESPRFSIFLLHASDLHDSSPSLETALTWLKEKRPVFFFSRDVSGLCSSIPKHACLEVPLSEHDLRTLRLSSQGFTGERAGDSEAMASYTQPFKAPAYTLGRRLGGGAYGNVFEAEIEGTGEKCAVKRMYLKEDEGDCGYGSSSQLRDIAHEVEIMSSLTHSNIVQYMFCDRDDNCISIFMELCTGGTLSSLITTGALVSKPGYIKQVLLDIIRAVAYLHSKKIVHRDLKPDNVLFNNGSAKVTDFGTAVLKCNRGGLHLVKGTFAYMAPEILVGELYGKECDVWSIGCIAAEVLAVDLPQRSFGLPEMSEFYHKMDMNASLEIECDVLPIKDFLCSCLRRDPAARSSATELLHHVILEPENTAIDCWMSTIAERVRETYQQRHLRTVHSYAGIEANSYVNSQGDVSLESSRAFLSTL